MIGDCIVCIHFFGSTYYCKCSHNEYSVLTSAHICRIPLRVVEKKMKCYIRPVGGYSFVYLDGLRNYFQHFMR